ncbi:hypothetical protein VHEMI01417 [[Torrubiella] hemipterigena]|uniref:Cyanovirin-N domain-containing protein n=1 Tax=[Torrubiella] hemipterigena TaxID=1531966 RepID=A0A0A1T7F5_9HYPO|nr:hypothetical protein VHEMI01417 [[Torrubiella] hemipterigena]
MYKSNLLFAALPLVLALPTSENTDGTLGALCTGSTTAHLYGYEDGCWQGFQKFSYELSAHGCNIRVANTDGRVHYITTDGSGDCKTISLVYFTERDMNGERSYASLERNRCINVNTGSSVESIQMYCSKST